MSLFLWLLVPPLLATLVAFLIGAFPRLVAWINGGLALVSLGAALTLGQRVLRDGAVVGGPSDFLRADALSALLAACVTLVSALAMWLGPGLATADAYTQPQVRRFQIFGNLFAFTMLFAVSTNNVGFMWIAIEATTITSAVLIPLQRSKASVEASWKYILIGSVGIALAFAGTVLGYFDFVTQVGHHPAALNWTVLRAAAPSLHPEVMQLAFVFLLVGYGTKAGLAPMHTWLPDAHAEAPVALSAMLSGVLLAVATYAIVRWKAVAEAAGIGAFANDLLAALGTLSLGVAAFSLLAQRNYKRMLAFSSIEHTGLTCLGLALGPLGTFAAMLHLVNHSLAKSMLFLLAGRVLHRYGTTDLAQVAGLLKVMPWTGGLFAAGILALVGLPPFGLFLSEFLLFRAGFAAGRPGLMAVLLVLLALAFIALVLHLNRMLYGTPPVGVTVGETRSWCLVPLGLCVAALVVFGVAVPAPVEALLTRIVALTAP
jgi:hydrogenase-4 component F